jgi:hypothetical protein
MTTRKIIQTASGIATLFLLASSAFAATAVDVQIQAGRGGRQEPFPPEAHKNAGPGAEQAAVTTLTKGGTQYIVTVWMSSDVNRTNGPWQGKCTSIKMDPIQGPVKMADQVQISNLRGNRPFNHPALGGANDLGAILLAYGSNDDNQTNVQTYAALLNEQCQLLTNLKQVRISNDNNNNQGAPHIVYQGSGRFAVGYYSNNDERTYMVGVQATSTSIQKTFTTVVGTNNNIGRPTQVSLAADRALSCFAHGNERPPERGVQCSLVDTSTGTKLWTQYVYQAQPSDWPGVNPGLYYNMPYVGVLDATHVVFQANTSQGQGRRRNRKGTSGEVMAVLAPTDTGVGLISTSMTGNMGSYQSHSALCTTKFGTNPTPSAVVFDTPIDDNGVAMLQFVTMAGSGAAMSMTPGIKKVASSDPSSGGLLANLYGQNPNNQGRDFMNCVGDVENPGYHVANGFQPDVKSFVVAPHGARQQGEYKNGMAMVFMPSVTDAPLPPDPTPPPGGMGGNGGGIGGNGTDPNGGNNNSGNNNPNNTSAPSMWGCSVGHGGSPAGALLVLAVAAGAMVISRRRRS